MCCSDKNETAFEFVSPYPTVGEAGTTGDFVQRFGLLEEVLFVLTVVLGVELSRVNRDLHGAAANSAGSLSFLARGSSICAHPAPFLT